MSLFAAGIVPHPPIIVPEIGGRELSRVKDTISALEKVAHSFVEQKLETLVIISPHGPVQPDSLVLQAGKELSGSFARFGKPEVSLNFTGDKELGRLIIKEAERAGVKAYFWQQDSTEALDHGALVPLYYLQKAGYKGKVVHVTFGLLPPAQLLQFGRALRIGLQKLEKRGGILASGDLSHRLTRGAPAGYHPDGAIFDRELVEAVSRNNVEKILTMDTRLVENAGECGLRSIIILLGALEKEPWQPKVHSYEGPFGVGYLVADYRLKKENPYVALAKKALEAKVRGENLKPPSSLPQELKEKAGAFVSLKKQGQLRGCIGTIEPTRDNLAQEIMANAVSAGLHDPRFPPVTLQELKELTFSVDVMGKPEPVAGVQDLEPQKYGVIVQQGNKKGLLLPDLEGVESAEQQVAIACQKAGIQPGENYQLYRFSVERHRQQEDD